ncbi:MAG: GxxExxY protein [Bacteroidetes bacterium B1(2017)]|nr:MAG: GxxExxY protein [Bacteroidetes bacterium B1(2017)]
MYTTSFLTENDLCRITMDCAFKVHKDLGPGLLESVYKECLFYEIGKTGIQVEKEKPIPLIYETVKLECGYRADLVLDNKFLIELKSLDKISDIHLAQTLTYLKLMDYKLGLLINFNVVFLKDGIKRVINGIL